MNFISEVYSLFIVTWSLVPVAPYLLSFTLVRLVHLQVHHALQVRQARQLHEGRLVQLLLLLLLHQLVHVPVLRLRGHELGRGSSLEHVAAPFQLLLLLQLLELALSHLHLVHLRGMLHHRLLLTVKYLRLALHHWLLLPIDREILTRHSLPLETGQRCHTRQLLGSRLRSLSLSLLLILVLQLLLSQLLGLLLHKLLLLHCVAWHAKLLKITCLLLRHRVDHLLDHRLGHVLGHLVVLHHHLL